jgi:predicted cupin superfamily sugar epimerase
MKAQDIIEHLHLSPHPEGGWYRQLRPHQRHLHLFPAGRDETSHWNKVDATEIWLYHAGAPLILSLSSNKTSPASDHVLCADLSQGAPQLIVPPHHWQAARSNGDWTLVSCTVSPGFQFDGFTLAPPDFDIPRG